MANRNQTNVIKMNIFSRCLSNYLPRKECKTRCLESTNMCQSAEIGIRWRDLNVANAYFAQV